MHKLGEKQTMLNKIERLGHIHTAGVDIGTVPHEVADGLDNAPCTHCGGTPWLVCKL